MNTVSLYDNTSQLTGVDASGGTCGATGCDESFSYDVNGNRTMSGYSTGTGNRLTADGTYSYTYDDNGNTLTKRRISDGQKYEFAWDYRNRLTQVLLKNSGGTILQESDYTHDAVNRRTIKSFDDDGPGPHSGTVTKTTYDGVALRANPYADFTGSNVLSMRYLYGPTVDMILARRDASGTVASQLTDHLRTIRDLVNMSGIVLDHISYSVYGKVTAETQSSNGDRFKYTGREHDTETGEYYLRHRYYDPNNGNFISQDPIGFASRESNLFRYVRNGPTIGSDPDGQMLEDPKPVSWNPAISWPFPLIPTDLPTLSDWDLQAMDSLVPPPHFPPGAEVPPLGPPGVPYSPSPSLPDSLHPKARPTIERFLVPSQPGSTITVPEHRLPPSLPITPTTPSMTIETPHGPVKVYLFDIEPEPMVRRIKLSNLVQMERFTWDLHQCDLPCNACPTCGDS